MTKGLRSIRSLPRESLRVVPAVVGKRLPKFENVDPKTLYVEDSYQRAIMERGTALIRKIIAEFSWSRFKPPICVRLADSGNILVCIDGQHTATATASHGGIEKIPVMIVDAADVPARAAAFVGHNKDRIALTTVMIHAAELAAEVARIEAENAPPPPPFVPIVRIHPMNRPMTAAESEREEDDAVAILLFLEAA